MENDNYKSPEPDGAAEEENEGSGQRVIRPYMRKAMQERETLRARSQMDIIIDLAVTFVLLHFLGFPGKMASVIGGEAVETLIDYGCFALQLGLMLISSDSELIELKLLDIKFKYMPIYLFGAGTVLISCLVTSDLKTDLITYTRLITTMSFGIWLSERYEPVELLEAWVRAEIVYVLVTLFFMLRYSSIAYQWHGENGRVLMGIVGNKNGFSKQMSFGILLELTLVRELLQNNKVPKPSLWGVFLLQLFMIIQNKSVGGLFFAFVPVAYLYTAEPALGTQARIPLGFLYVVGSVVFLFIALTILPLLVPLFEAMGKDATLTGRVPLWRQIISVISSTHTLFGWGYPRFWKEKEAYSLVHAGFKDDTFFATMTSGSHNVLLEMTLYVGLVGLVIFLLMFILSMRSVPYMKEEQYIFCSSFLMMFMLSGLTERGMAAEEYMTLMLFCVLGMACGVERPISQQMRRRPKPDE